MADKYRLLKNIPDAPEGTVLIYNPLRETYDYLTIRSESAYYSKNYVEDNGYWFEKIEETSINKMNLHSILYDFRNWNQKWEGKFGLKLQDSDEFIAALSKKYQVFLTEEKRYTEEDMRRCWETSRVRVVRDPGFCWKDFDEYLQSLTNK